MYPFLKEGVSIGSFSYEDSDDIHYFIENAYGDQFEIDYQLRNALLQADGTKPLNLPDHGLSILPELKKYGIVQTSRFIDDDGIFNRFVLFPLSNHNKNISLICKAINAVLPIVSVLFFIIGLYCMKSDIAATEYTYSWLLYYGLIFFSLVFHEIGHLVAGLAYGYEVRNIGILLLGILPTGAYVAYDDKKDASKTEKIQLALAGIEANLLLAGICMMIATQYPPLYMLMSSIANINVVFALVNSIPSFGLDGEAALSALYGIDNIGKAAKKWLFSKKHRQKLLHSGPSGYIFFCVFTVIMISKLLFGLFICFDIISILLKFF